MQDADILLVDDNMDFIKSISKPISRKGFKVSFALNGEEALHHLEKNPQTDVVVLDMKMPGMSGLETLQWIKARHPLIEVLILTGYVDVEDGLDSLKTGATAYLVKPFDIERLVEKLIECVAVRREKETEIVEVASQRKRAFAV